MGKRDPQKQLWNYQVNLDKGVRSDHPLRRINQALDMDFRGPELAKQTLDSHNRHFVCYKVVQS
jgi:hypothetical protein